MVPADTEVIGHNDLVTVVGPRDLLDAVARQLGHISSHDIVADPEALEACRVDLTVIGGTPMHDPLGLAV